MPASITTRATAGTGATVKGSPLTNAEIDNNFINLNTTKLDSNGSGASLTALNAANVSSGTLAVLRGGTGLSATPTAGQILIGTSAGVYTNAGLTAGTNISITAGSGSISIATSATPSFSSVDASGATFNLANSTATTVNIGGGASTINVGAASSTLTLNSSTLAIPTTFTMQNAGTAAQTVSIASAATSSGNTKTINFGTGGVSGSTTAITIGSTTSGATSNITLGSNTGTTTVNSPTVTFAGATTVNINGANPTIAASSTGTLTLFNTNIATVNALGVATAITIGATTGTATIRNATVTLANATTLNISGTNPSIVASGTVSLFNSGVTTLNIGGAATTIAIGAATGTLTVNNTTLAAKAITASTTLGVTGNTTLSTVTVSGAITQGTAVHGVPSGSAPLFSARAWGVLDGTVRTDVTGTYSQSNGAGVAGTIVTVTTAAAHGLEVGDVFFSDITTGTGVDGWYTVTGVTSTTIFTYTGGTSLLTSGNITLPRCNISAGGNIKSFVSTNNVANATAGGGGYWVSFTTNMASANYATMGTSRFADSLSGTNTLVFVTYGHTIHGFYIGPCDNNADNLYKSQYISFAIFA